jgi:hypothetical protein
MPRPLLGCTLVAVLFVGLAPAEDKPAATTKAAPARGKAKDPVPGYELRTIEGFTVLINRKALAEIEASKGQYEVEPLEVLENEFHALNQILFPAVLTKLQGVRVWVEWDDVPPGVSLSDEAKANGPRVVALYRSGSPLRAAAEGKIHPGKINAVEVMTLKRLTEMHQPGRNKSQIVLLHELCHAAHHVYMPGGFENLSVKAAYQQAMERRLYAGGDGHPPAYARTSPAEYFAEISCAYLDRCNFYPHTADELKEYDPAGYQLMEKVWGKPEKIAAARERAARERETRARYRRAFSGGPKSAPAPPADVRAADPEKVAAQKLEFIRALVQDGKKDRAKERLNELMKAYPGTRAASDAQTLLKELQ